MKYLLPAFIFCLNSFGLTAQISTSSFDLPIAYTVFSGTINGSINLECADLNNDGKQDVTVINQSNSTLSIFKNIGIQGIINSGTFAGKIDMVLGTPTYGLNFLKFVYLDNDNLIDLVVSTGGANGVAVLRNTSDTVTGNISFATPIFYSAQTNTSGVDVADLDGDNKHDIVVANYGANSITVFKNNSTGSGISFSAGVNYTSGFSSLNQLILADLDLDGKKDVVVFNYGSNNTRIYQNTSTVGSIILNNVLALAGNIGVFRGDIGDMNSDGKPDIIASSNITKTTSIYRNVSTVGTINFLSQSYYSADYALTSSRVIDLNGDGKLEMLQTCGDVTNKITVKENFATLHTDMVNSTIPTLSASLSIPGGNPTGMAFADIDRDGKTDVLVAGFNAPTSFFVFKNRCVTPNGLTAFYSFQANVADSSPYNNPLTSPLPSGCSYATDRNNDSNAALYFNGTTNAGLFASNNSPSTFISTYKNLSLSLWCKPDTGLTGNNLRTLLNFFDTTRQFVFSYNQSNGKLVFANASGWPYPPVTFWSVTSKGVLMPNVWQQVALTFDSLNRLTFYINGIADSTFQLPGILYPQSYSALEIGRSSASVPSTAPWRGALDEIKLYRVLLSPAQIQSIYNQVFTYYSKSSGPLNLLTSWGKNVNGSGIAPGSFNAANTQWQINNLDSISITANWTVTGSNSALVLNSGRSLHIPIGLSITADSIILKSNSNVSVFGNLSFQKSYFDTLTTVQYLGTQAQTIFGNSFFNLTSTGGIKILQQPIVVRNALTLNASINTGIHQITVGTSAIQKGTINSSGASVIGRLCRWVNPQYAELEVVFPIGTASSALPVQLVFAGPISNAGTITTQFVNAYPGNSGLPLVDMSLTPTVLNRTYKNGYWQLLSGNGLTLGVTTFEATFNGNGFYGINNLSKLRMVNRMNTGVGPWMLSGVAGINAGTLDSPRVNRVFINSFGDFAFATDSTFNSLPVTLNKFDGFFLDPIVKLVWETGSEINNDYFVIERSTDAVHFIPLAKIKGHNNSNSLRFYEYIDSDANITDDGIYYRLQQVDLDGVNTYSKIVRIAQKKDNNRQVFPNPVYEKLTISESLNVSVYNSFGFEIPVERNGNTLDFTGFSPGIYFVKVDGYSHKVIKK